MAQQSRIYSEVHQIDYEATRDFWDYRASLAGQVNPLSMTMFQDENADLVDARNQHEKALILPQLPLSPDTHVLDIGCGNGRWGLEFVGQVGSYLGIDFSAGLIDFGRQQLKSANAEPNFQLQHLSATDIAEDALLRRGPFSLFIVSGLCLYLNDEDVKAVFRQVSRLADANSLIYVREPIAVGRRLTLDNHRSIEMNCEYSAIYRARSSYEELFADSLLSAGFHIAVSEFLYPDDLSNRKETSQFYWLLEN